MCAHLALVSIQFGDTFHSQTLHLSGSEIENFRNSPTHSEIPLIKILKSVFSSQKKREVNSDELIQRKCWIRTEQLRLQGAPKNH